MKIVTIFIFLFLDNLFGQNFEKALCNKQKESIKRVFLFKKKDRRIYIWSGYNQFNLKELPEPPAELGVWEVENKKLKIFIPRNQSTLWADVIETDSQEIPNRIVIEKTEVLSVKNCLKI